MGISNGESLPLSENYRRSLGKLCSAVEKSNGRVLKKKYSAQEAANIKKACEQLRKVQGKGGSTNMDGANMNLLIIGIVLIGIFVVTNYIPQSNRPHGQALGGGKSSEASRPSDSRSDFVRNARAKFVEKLEKQNKTS